MDPILLEDALHLAQFGFFVFPVHDFAQGACSCGTPNCPRAAKHPRTARGLNDATTDEALIRTWWESWPNANIGINCGLSGLAVIDVDCKKGALGFATIGPIEAAYPEAFAHAPRSSTPSGGMHIWGMGTVKGGAGVIGPGIDVQSIGRYVLAPRSIGQEGPYRWIKDGTMPPWPAELLAMMGGKTATGRMTLGSIASAPQDIEPGTRNRIPRGEHRKALLDWAISMRKHQGLDAETLLPQFRAYAHSEILEDRDPNDPFSDSDLLRMLKSVDPRITTDQPMPPSTEVVWASDVLPEDDYELEWLIENYIPLSELTLLYGESTVGKSTLMACIAAYATKCGFRFGVVGNEDARNVFMTRAKLCGAVPSMLCSPKDSVRGLKLDNYDFIEKIITEHGLRVLYFDAIRSHFPPSKADAATATRDALEPVKDMARKLGCAILGTFHPNKSGEYSGSTEMKNVPRVLLHGTSTTKGKETLFYLDVVATNFTQPETKRCYRRVVQPYLNASGLPLMQSVAQPGGGRLRTPRTISTWQYVEDVPRGRQQLGEAATIEEHPHSMQISVALLNNPNVSASALYKTFGGNRSKFFAEVKRLRDVHKLAPQAVEEA